MRLSLFIARRLLLRQKGSFSAFMIRLAAGATALSVAVMIIATAVVTGFQAVIEQKLYTFWGHVMVTPYSLNPTSLVSDEPIEFDNRLLMRMQAVAPQAHITPYALQPAILRTDSALEGIQLKGIPDDYRVPEAMEATGKIDFSDTAYSKDILLSRTIANRLRLKPGDRPTLYFIHSGSEAPRIRRLRVAGLYHTGLEEVDRNFALCDMRLVQHLAGWEPILISGYQLHIPDARQAGKVSDLLHQQVLENPLQSYTLSKRYPQIFDWLQLQATNVNVLLIIMAVIAIINLATALLILMVERTRTVGLLHALGMNQRSLMRIFIYLAVGIGIIGCFLGTGFALLLSFIQNRTGFMKLPEETYYMHTVPVQPVWWHLILINVVTLLLCLLCMTLPALYLRRLSPTKALQFR